MKVDFVFRGGLNWIGQGGNAGRGGLWGDKISLLGMLVG